MLHPTRRLALAAAVPAALSVAAVWSPALLVAALAADALLAAAATLDGVLAWGWLRRLEAGLSTPATWSLGRREEVRVAIEHRHRLPVRLLVAPDLPPELGAEDGARALRLPGRSRGELAWSCRARRRGDFPLAGVHLAVAGPLGLWRRRALLPAPARVHVYPDLKQLGEYALLARADRLQLLGVRVGRRAGGDTEFDRLRDWRSGDPLSRMDWKATARRDLPTAREYRTSQNQGLVLLVDAGRMMAGHDPGRPGPLDQAIDAALMLAWVAVRQGDRVGLVAYADGVRAWVPPRGGPGQVARLVHALHDLHAEPVESRHEDAFLHLERHERKRSLVVVLSNVLDEVAADHLERHCRRLAGRHLPLAALLQDPAVQERLPEGPALARAAADDRAFWRAGAAAAVAWWRLALLERLRRQGCLVVDAPAERFSAGLLNRYLEVKARNLL